MKKLLAILLVFTMCFGLCACELATLGSGKETTEPQKSEEEKVWDAVYIQERATEAVDSRFTTIGGNAIKSVSTNITNIKKVADDEYLVNGTITKTDVYGTRWNNQFDCKVTSSDDGETWHAGSFEYKSSSWTKG